MSYPINPNIPATNDDPADDQPIMQRNFSSINGFLGVDHINPGTTGDGFHKQITFYSNNPPTVPTTSPILFSNIQDGAGNNLPSALAQLFLYTGTATQSKNQNVSTLMEASFLWEVSL